MEKPMATETSGIELEQRGDDLNDGLFVSDIELGTHVATFHGS